MILDRRRRWPSSSGRPSPGSRRRRAATRRRRGRSADGAPEGARRSRSTSAFGSTPRPSTCARALRLYEAGKRAAGRASCSRGTTRSRRGSASRSAAGPTARVARLTQLSGLHPKSAAVQLNLGLARFWAGEGGAEGRLAVGRRARAGHRVRGHRRQPAPSRLRAQPARLRPVGRACRRPFAGSRPRPSSRALERRARTGTAADRLFYGVALQRLGRQRSAERVYAAAARAGAERPRGAGRGGRRALRQGAARRRRSRGSGRSRATFPKAATVRFHLGLLLLWSGQVKEARRQLRARSDRRARLAARRRGEALPRRAAHGGHLTSCRTSFLTLGVSDGYGHTRFDGKGRC